MLNSHYGKLIKMEMITQRELTGIRGGVRGNHQRRTGDNFSVHHCPQLRKGED